MKLYYNYALLYEINKTDIPSLAVEGHKHSLCAVTDQPGTSTC